MNPAAKNTFAVVGILSLLLALFISMNSNLLLQMIRAESLDTDITLGVCVLVGTASLGILLGFTSLRGLSALAWTLWSLVLLYGLAVVAKMDFLTVLSTNTNLVLMSASLWINGLILTYVGHFLNNPAASLNLAATRNGADA
jgi:hypothetical protein